MDGTQDQNDVIINRLNLQLMRTRNIINSWTSPKQGLDEGEDEVIDNDDEFVTSGESAGVGSQVKNDDESALPTKRSATKERLLEQLIGKKAANAKRKEDAHKSMSTSKHAAPKPLTHKVKESKRQEESEDEEEGRAAAFQSKKSAKSKPQAQAAEKVSDLESEDDESGALNAKATRRDRNDAENDVSSTLVDSRQQKRKGGGSYLDELLSKKAKKSKRKKQVS